MFTATMACGWSLARTSNPVQPAIRSIGAGHGAAHWRRTDGGRGDDYRPIRQCERQSHEPNPYQRCENRDIRTNAAR